MFTFSPVTNITYLVWTTLMLMMPKNTNSCVARHYTPGWPTPEATHVPSDPSEL